MRRWALRICVFLLLGAIVNVAVAWGFSLRSWQSGLGQEWLADDASIEWWRQNAPPGFPPLPVTMYESQSLGYRGLMLYETEGLDAGCEFLGFRTGHGWPLVSLEWTSWINRQLRTVENRYMIEWDRWPSAKGTSRKIPLRPLWSGFALNTVFYAFLISLMFAALIGVRRRRRIRRGLCPKCAYDLRGTRGATACPECGATTRSQDSSTVCQ